MAWTEQRVTRLSQLSGLIEEHSVVATPDRAVMVYRGVANAAYSLEPSLQRLVAGTTAEEALKIEDACIRDFKASAHLFVPPSQLPKPTDDDFEWLPLMQHFGAPTRLLDWTTSIYVAAYFAVEKDMQRDGAIWLFNPWPVLRKLETVHGSDKATFPAMLPRFRQAHAGQELQLIRQTEHNPRSHAQQGIYTICQDIFMDQSPVLDAILAPTASTANENYSKLIIPAEAKPAILAHLRHMNVTAHSLFPGIEGVARSCAELARLMIIDHRPRPDELL